MLARSVRKRSVVRTVQIAALVALATGCTIPSAESVFEIPDPPHDGGTQPSLGAPSQSGNGDQPTESADGSACNVQGNASVSGALNGSTLDAKDAIEVFDPTKGTFTFLITDYASACAVGNATHPGSNVVAITYDKTMLGSGTYDVAQTQGLAASFSSYNSACKASTTMAAASGTITFKLDTCGGEGSFDLTFGADHLTGSFTASVCAATGGAGECQ